VPGAKLEQKNHFPICNVQNHQTEKYNRDKKKAASMGSLAYCDMFYFTIW